MHGQQPCRHDYCRESWAAFDGVRCRTCGAVLWQIVPSGESSTAWPTKVGRFPITVLLAVWFAVVLSGCVQPRAVDFEPDAVHVEREAFRVEANPLSPVTRSLASPLSDWQASVGDVAAASPTFASSQPVDQRVIASPQGGSQAGDGSSQTNVVAQVAGSGWPLVVVVIAGLFAYAWLQRSRRRTAEENSLVVGRAIYALGDGRVRQRLLDDVQLRFARQRDLRHRSRALFDRLLKRDEVYVQRQSSGAGGRGET